MLLCVTRSLKLVFCFSVAMAVGCGGGGGGSSVVAPAQGDYTMVLTEFTQHGGNYAMDVKAPEDGSGRVFTATISGQIHAFDSSGNSLGTFLDMVPTAATTGFVPTSASSSFSGLTYFDFHPDYADVNADGYGKVYVVFKATNDSGTADYIVNTGGAAITHMVVGEWSVDGADPDRIDTDSFREVLRLAFRNSWHSIGQISFNPLSAPADDDYGLLYVAVGDSNNSNRNPEPGYVQNLDNPFGTLLRIDPLQNGADAYSIPATNPFDDGGPLHDDDGVAEEIYAYGFRDPQTFSFAKDGSGESVVVTFDIGASEREEVDLVRSGGNYGWDRHEGTLELNSDRPLVVGSVHAPPVLEYDHDTGRAIIGGFVVNDPDDPRFRNQLVFSDLPTGKMFHADYAAMLAAEIAGEQAPIFEIPVNIGGSVGNFADLIGHQNGRGDARFGFDGAGNVYIVTKWSNSLFATGLVLAEFPAP